MFYAQDFQETIVPSYSDGCYIDVYKHIKPEWKIKNQRNRVTSKIKNSKLKFLNFC